MIAVRRKSNLAVNLCVYCLLLPGLIAAGIFLWRDRQYTLVSIAAAVLACVPMFLRFERGHTGARELVVIAVLTALSVLGRFLFAAVPGFKPLTAVVIIAGLACGAEAGFLVGAMSALVSDIFFGQGPWTPFQMLAWGAIGLLSGFFAGKDRRPNVALLLMLGLAGAVLFSCIMDIWTVLAMGEGFESNRYLAVLTAGLPLTALYAVSNIVFLLVLTRPILSKLGRLRMRYGIFDSKSQ